MDEKGNNINDLIEKKWKLHWLTKDKREVQQPIFKQMQKFIDLWYDLAFFISTNWGPCSDFSDRDKQLTIIYPTIFQKILLVSMYLPHPVQKDQSISSMQRPVDLRTAGMANAGPVPDKRRTLLQQHNPYKMRTLTNRFRKLGSIKTLPVCHRSTFLTILFWIIEQYLYTSGVSCYVGPK